MQPSCYVATVPQKALASSLGGFSAQYLYLVQPALRLPFKLELEMYVYICIYVYFLYNSDINTSLQLLLQAVIKQPKK